MEEHADPVDVGIGVEMIDARRVEGAGAADDAVNLIALAEQQVREVTPVLPRDPGDERAFHFVPTINDASTARCAAINSPMPFLPKTSIPSSSSLENVASSPEPCISTNSPSSVATRLKSTVTALSSS